jgi:hypothetical protein
MTDPIANFVLSPLPECPKIDSTGYFNSGQICILGTNIDPNCLQISILIIPDMFMYPLNCTCKQ